MPMATKEAQKRYQREWVANRRKNFLQDKACVYCGGIEELNVHHKNPALKVSHNIWSWSEEKRDIELKKCEILCKSCHVKHHQKEGTFRTMLGKTPVNAKLNSEIIIKIRQLKNLSLSNCKIGLQLGIPRQTIDDIISGRSWSWV